MGQNKGCQNLGFKIVGGFKDAKGGKNCKGTHFGVQILWDIKSLGGQKFWVCG